MRHTRYEVETTQALGDRRGRQPVGLPFSANQENRQTDCIYMFVYILR